MKKWIASQFVPDGKNAIKLKVKAEMPCFAAHQKRVEAHVESTGDKKVSLVIHNVKVSEIKLIMDFIAELRAKKTL